MAMRFASVLALALTACVLTACSGDEDPTPHPQVTASDSEVRLVASDDADLVLYVSNQSFEDETVRLKLAVDGVTVVDGEFRVEGQRNWIRFPLSLSPGIFGLPDDESETIRGNVSVPGGLSLLLHGDAKAEVIGLDRFRPEDRPPVAIAFFSYHLMVGIGDVLHRAHGAGVVAALAESRCSTSAG